MNLLAKLCLEQFPNSIQLRDDLKSIEAASKGNLKVSMKRSSYYLVYPF
jgi:hypothetical protein